VVLFGREGVGTRRVLGGLLAVVMEEAEASNNGGFTVGR